MSQKVLSKQEASDFFDALDADGSGQCSFREIKQGLKKHFAEFYGQACDDYFMVSILKSLLLLLFLKALTSRCIY